MKFEVNQKMLPMKAHYFFYNAGNSEICVSGNYVYLTNVFVCVCVYKATAPVVPFMPTLARQLGFSTVVVGTVYTILPIIGLLVKPLFGFLADR